MDNSGATAWHPSRQWGHRDRVPVLENRLTQSGDKMHPNVFCLWGQGDEGAEMKKQVELLKS